MSLPLGERYSYTMQSVSGRESISQYFVSPDLINLIWDLGSRGTIVAWYRIWCRSLPSQVCPRHDNALSSAGNDGAGWFSRGGTVRQRLNERCGVALQSLSAVRRQGPVDRSWAPPSGPHLRKEPVNNLRLYGIHYPATAKEPTAVSGAMGDRLAIRSRPPLAAATILCTAHAP